MDSPNRTPHAILLTLAGSANSRAAPPPPPPPAASSLRDNNRDSLLDSSSDGSRRPSGNGAGGGGGAGFGNGASGQSPARDSTAGYGLGASASASPPPPTQPQYQRPISRSSSFGSSRGGGFNQNPAPAPAYAGGEFGSGDSGGGYGSGGGAGGGRGYVGGGYGAQPPNSAQAGGQAARGGYNDFWRRHDSYVTCYDLSTQFRSSPHQSHRLACYDAVPPPVSEGQKGGAATHSKSHLPGGRGDVRASGGRRAAASGSYDDDAGYDDEFEGKYLAEEDREEFYGSSRDSDWEGEVNATA
eukprot:gene4524-14684_t